MEEGRTVLFTGVDRPLSMKKFPLVSPEPGSVLVRIEMCTICGSDLHTRLGHRPGETPMILGLPVAGRVVELGEGVRRDSLSRDLEEGDLITWSIWSSCGDCYFCRVKDLPQKCVELWKYGHVRSDCSPFFTGGLADYIYLRPGTVILKVPPGLTPAEVTPANCTAATAACGLEMIGVDPGDTVVVQGAGLLGLFTAAMAKTRGAGQVIAVDINENRLDLAREFGADSVIYAGGVSDDELCSLIGKACRRYGADLIVEAAGTPAVIPVGLRTVGTGGRYLLMGLVFAGADVEFDANVLIAGMLTMRGVHNYGARHLVEAVEFIEQHRDRFPFDRLVAERFPLEEAEEAMRRTGSGVPGRVAVVPNI